MDFLYPLTKAYYGESGQNSIDPVVFFKLCLVDYLENIISNRRLIEYSNMRLDILGYDIDEELPRHPVISCNCQLYPESVLHTLKSKRTI